jgi:hypothetical protein
MISVANTRASLAAAPPPSRPRSIISRTSSITQSSLPNRDEIFCGPPPKCDCSRIHCPTVILNVQSRPMAEKTLDPSLIMAWVSTWQ